MPFSSTEDALKQSGNLLLRVASKRLNDKTNGERLKTVTLSPVRFFQPPKTIRAFLLVRGHLLAASQRRITVLSPSVGMTRRMRVKVNIHQHKTQLQSKPRAGNQSHPRPMRVFRYSCEGCRRRLGAKCRRDSHRSQDRTA